MVKRLILKINGKTIQDDLLEDVINSSTIRYFYHRDITEAYDAWGYGGETNEAVYIYDSEGEVVEEYYKTEKEMQEMISSKNFDSLDNPFGIIIGECKHGDIRLYIEEEEEE